MIFTCEEMGRKYKIKLVWFMFHYCNSIKCFNYISDLYFIIVILSNILIILVIYVSLL